MKRKGFNLYSFAKSETKQLFQEVYEANNRMMEY